jgi:hypothetical protein
MTGQEIKNPFALKAKGIFYAVVALDWWLGHQQQKGRRAIILLLSNPLSTFCCWCSRGTKLVGTPNAA